MDVVELAHQIEYKVAPEPLIAVQGLANTFAVESQEERLLSPNSTRDWLVESDLVVATLEVGEREWRRLVEFREAVRDLIDANLSGDAEGAAARLAALVAAHPPELAIGEGGRLSLDLEPAKSIDGVIAQLIGIIFQAQLEGEWPRLKICASDECRWAFFDSSRNRGGTWCQMEVCGNRIKNRAYRRRKGSRPASSGPA